MHHILAKDPNIVSTNIMTSNLCHENLFKVADSFIGVFQNTNIMTSNLCHQKYLFKLADSNCPTCSKNYCTMCTGMLCQHITQQKCSYIFRFKYQLQNKKKIHAHRSCKLIQVKKNEKYQISCLCLRRFFLHSYTLYAASPMIQKRRME